MNDTHAMAIEIDDEESVVFACEEAECGRRVRLGRTGGFQVLARGDFLARHSASTGPLIIGAGISE